MPELKDILKTYYKPGADKPVGDLGAPLYPVQNFDLNQFRKTLGEDIYGDYQSLLKQRDATQTDWESTANMIGKGIGKAVLTVPESLGILFDAYEILSITNNYDNKLSEWARNSKSWLDETMPEYSKDLLGASGESFSPNNKSWWFRNGDSALESIGYIIPGFAIGKGLSLGLKALNATRAITEIGSAIGAATAMNYVESIQMAKELYDNSVEELVTKGVDMTAAKEIASSEASQFVWQNKINLAFEIPQYLMLFKGMRSGSAYSAKNIAESFAMKNLKEYVEQGASEYGEEVFSGFLQKENERDARIAAGVEDKDNSSFASRLYGYVKSDQGKTEGFLGFIGGAGMKGGTDLVSWVGDKYSGNPTASQRRLATLEFIKNNESNIKELLSKNGKIFEEDMKKSVEKDEEFNFKAAVKKAFYNLAYANATKGTYEQFENTLNALEKITPDEAAAMELDYDLMKEMIPEMKEQAEYMKKLYNETERKYGNYSPAFREHITNLKHGYKVSNDTIVDIENEILNTYSKNKPKVAEDIHQTSIRAAVLREVLATQEDLTDDVKATLESKLKLAEDLLAKRLEEEKQAGEKITKKKLADPLLDPIIAKLQVQLISQELLNEKTKDKIDSYQDKKNIDNFEKTLKEFVKKAKESGKKAGRSWNPFSKKKETNKEEAPVDKKEETPEVEIPEEIINEGNKTANQELEAEQLKKKQETEKINNVKATVQEDLKSKGIAFTEVDGAIVTDAGKITFTMMEDGRVVSKLIQKNKKTELSPNQFGDVIKKERETRKNQEQQKENKSKPLQRIALSADNFKDVKVGDTVGVKILATEGELVFRVLQNRELKFVEEYDKDGNPTKTQDTEKAIDMMLASNLSELFFSMKVPFYKIVNAKQDNGKPPVVNKTESKKPKVEPEYEKGDYNKVLQLVRDTISGKEVKSPEQIRLIANYPKLFEEYMRIEKEREEALKNRVVYDRKPTVEDGEFKIVGDPTNRTFRVNENTGRPQVLDESNGLWSNTEESPNLFFEIVSRSGFEKSKGKINAKFDAELEALEQSQSNQNDAIADIKRRRQEVRGDALERIGVDRVGFDGKQRQDWKDAKNQDLKIATNHAIERLSKNSNVKIGSLPSAYANAIKAELEIHGVKTTDKTSISEIIEKLKEINAKYDAELDALNNQTTSEQQTQTEQQKADIKRRRSLTTKTADGLPQGFESEGIWYFDYISPTGIRTQYRGKDKQSVLNEIYAKYDEELDAVVNKTEKTSTDKKAYIERRRQEELNKVNQKIEKLKQKEDRRVKTEKYRTLDINGNPVEVEITTNADGTRVLKARQINEDGSVEPMAYVTERINNKAQASLTNEKLIEGYIGNEGNTLKRTNIDENPDQTYIDKINAKYDAEYINAVKKGEMTKEQAMKALEEVGRKDSKAYAELAALEEEEDIEGDEETTDDLIEAGDIIQEELNQDMFFDSDTVIDKPEQTDYNSGIRLTGSTIVYKSTGPTFNREYVDIDHLYSNDFTNKEGLQLEVDYNWIFPTYTNTYLNLPIVLVDSVEASKPKTRKNQGRLVFVPVLEQNKISDEDRATYGIEKDQLDFKAGTAKLSGVIKSLVEVDKKLADSSKENPYWENERERLIKLKNDTIANIELNQSLRKSFVQGIKNPEKITQAGLKKLKPMPVKVLSQTSGQIQNEPNLKPVASFFPNYPILGIGRAPQIISVGIENDVKITADERYGITNYNLRRPGGVYLLSEPTPNGQKVPIKLIKGTLSDLSTMAQKHELIDFLLDKVYAYRDLNKVKSKKSEKVKAARAIIEELKDIYQVSTTSKEEKQKRGNFIIDFHRYKGKGKQSSNGGFFAVRKTVKVGSGKDAVYRLYEYRFYYKGETRDGVYINLPKNTLNLQVMDITDPSPVQVGSTIANVDIYNSGKGISLEGVLSDVQFNIRLDKINKISKNKEGQSVSNAPKLFGNKETEYTKFISTYFVYTDVVSVKDGEVETKFNGRPVYFANPLLRIEAAPVETEIKKKRKSTKKVEKEEEPVKSTPEDKPEESDDISDYLMDMLTPEDTPKNRVANLKDSYQKANMDKALNWMKTNMPHVPVEVYSGLIYNGIGYSYGMFKNSMVILSDLMETGTEYHEAFHAAFNLFKSPSERAQILKEARAKFGIPTKEDLKVFAEEQSLEDLNNAELIDAWLEEKMAEEFRNLVVSGSLLNNYNNYRGIKKLFYQLLKFIKDILPFRSSMKKLYDDINYGEFNYKPIYKGSKIARNSIARTQNPYFTPTQEQSILKALTGMYLHHYDAVRKNGGSLKQIKESLRNNIIKFADSPKFAANKTAWDNVLKSFDPITNQGVVTYPGLFIRIMSRLERGYGFKFEAKGMDISFSDFEEIEKLWDKPFVMYNPADSVSSITKQEVMKLLDGKLDPILGIKTFMNFREVWPTLQRRLADKTSLSEMIKGLQDLSDIYDSKENKGAGIDLLIKKLKGEFGTSIQDTFYQSFNKVTQTLLELIVDKSDQGYTLRMYNPTSKGYQVELLGKWNSAFKTRKLDKQTLKGLGQVLSSKLGEASRLVKKNEIDKAIDIYAEVYTELTSSKSGKEKNLEKFKKGLLRYVNDEKNIKEAQIQDRRRTKNSIARTMMDKIHNSLVFGPVKSLHDGIEPISSQTTNDWAMAVEIFSPFYMDLYDNMTQTIKGEKSYNVNIPNRISVFFNELKSANKDEVRELLSKYSYLEHSNWLKKMINEDGTINIPEIEKFSSVYLNGIRFTDEAGIEYKEAQGLHTSLLSFAGFLNAEITKSNDKTTWVMDAPYEADKNHHYFVVVPRYSSSYDARTDKYIYSVENESAAALLNVAKAELKDILDLKERVLGPVVDGKRANLNPDGSFVDSMDSDLLYKDFTYKTKDGKKFPGNGFNFYFLDALNSKTDQELRELTDKDLFKLIEEKMEKELQKTMALFVEDGLIKWDGKEYVSDFINDYYIKDSFDGNLEKAIRAFTVNYTIGLSEFKYFISGTEGEFKNVSDEFKRMPGIGSPAQYNSTENINKEFGVLAINDIEFPAPSLAKIKEVSKLSDAELSYFESITSNDGGAWATINRYEEILKGQGRYPTDSKKIEIIERIKAGEATAEDYKEMMINPIKGFSFNRNYDPKLGRHVTQMIKYAVYPLIKQFTEGTELDSLRTKVEELEKTSKVNIEIIPESGLKVGAKNILNIANADGTLNISSLNNAKVSRYPNKYWGIQQDIPEHGLDYTQKLGVQIAKIMTADIVDTVSYDVKGAGKLTGKQLKQIYQGLISSNVDETMGYLLSSIDYNHSTGEFNEERFAEIIKRELIDRESPENLINYLETKNGKFVLSPEFSAVKFKMLEVSKSVFNKVKEQELPGLPLVQIPNVFLQRIRGAITKTPEGTNLIEGHDGNLKMIYENNSVVAEAILPRWSKKFFDKDGNPIDINEIAKQAPEILNLIGYRIPYQSKSFSFTLKVVGFSDKIAGDIIALPSELMKHMGYDFDIDKLFIVTKDFNKEGDKFINMSLDTDPKNWAKRYKEIVEEGVQNYWKNKLSVNYNEELQEILNLKKLESKELKPIAELKRRYNRIINFFDELIIAGKRLTETEKLERDYFLEELRVLEESTKDKVANINSLIKDLETAENELIVEELEKRRILTPKDKFKDLPIWKQNIRKRRNTGIVDIWENILSQDIYNDQKHYKEVIENGEFTELEEAVKGLRQDLKDESIDSRSYSGQRKINARNKDGIVMKGIMASSNSFISVAQNIELESTIPVQIFVGKNDNSYVDKFGAAYNPDTGVLSLTGIGKIKNSDDKSDYKNLHGRLITMTHAEYVSAIMDIAKKATTPYLNIDKNNASVASLLISMGVGIPGKGDKAGISSHKFTGAFMLQPVLVYLSKYERETDGFLVEKSEDRFFSFVNSTRDKLYEALGIPSVSIDGKILSIKSRENMLRGIMAATETKIRYKWGENYVLDYAQMYNDVQKKWKEGSKTITPAKKLSNLIDKKFNSQAEAITYWKEHPEELRFIIRQLRMLSTFKKLKDVGNAVTKLNQAMNSDRDFSPDLDSTFSKKDYFEAEKFNQKPTLILKGGRNITEVISENSNLLSAKSYLEVDNYALDIIGKMFPLEGSEYIRKVITTYLEESMRVREDKIEDMSKRVRTHLGAYIMSKVPQFQKLSEKDVSYYFSDDFIKKFESIKEIAKKNNLTIFDFMGVESSPKDMVRNLNIPIITLENERLDSFSIDELSGQLKDLMTGNLTYGAEEMKEFFKKLMDYQYLTTAFLPLKNSFARIIPYEAVMDSDIPSYVNNSFAQIKEVLDEDFFERYVQHNSRNRALVYDLGWIKKKKPIILNNGTVIKSVNSKLVGREYISSSSEVEVNGQVFKKVRLYKYVGRADGQWVWMEIDNLGIPNKVFEYYTTESNFEINKAADTRDNIMNWIKENVEEFTLKGMFTEELNEEVEESNEVTNEIKFEEDDSPNYQDRTKKNASADATIAIAIDFDSAGEKLTKTSVLNQNKKYIPIDANKLEVTKERVEKIVNALNSTNKKEIPKIGDIVKITFEFEDKSTDVQAKIINLESHIENNVFNKGFSVDLENIKTGKKYGVYVNTDGNISQFEGGKGLRIGTDNYIEAFDIESSSKNEISLNIAGNGIYTMKGKYTQQQVDDFTYELLKAVIDRGNLPKVEEFKGFWSRQQVAEQRDKVFLFGDNTDDRLNTKYVPSSTQAVIRGLPNAIGIDTKKNRGTNEGIKVQSENISSKGSEFAKKLTNVGNNVGLVYKGKQYVNSEHAYQTWKSGEFNQEGYNLKGGKVRGGKIGDTFNIMIDILTEKLKQHPDLIKGINERGGLDYILKSTHNVIGDNFWESTGQNKFIEALYQAAINVGIKNNTSSYFTDADFPQFKQQVDEAIQQAKNSGKTIVIPADGIGTGKAMLKEKAPKLFEYLQQKLQELKSTVPLKTKIESIRTGGQTGFDEAGAKAGINLGIPTQVLAPKGWKFRDESGKDISNEEKFKERFNTKKTNKAPVVKDAATESFNSLTEEEKQVVESVALQNPILSSGLTSKEFITNAAISEINKTKVKYKGEKGLIKQFNDVVKKFINFVLAIGVMLSVYMGTNSMTFPNQVDVASVEAINLNLDNADSIQNQLWRYNQEMYPGQSMVTFDKLTKQVTITDKEGNIVFKGSGILGSSKGDVKVESANYDQKLDSLLKAGVDPLKAKYKARDQKTSRITPSGIFTLQKEIDTTYNGNFKYELIGQAMHGMTPYFHAAINSPARQGALDSKSIEDNYVTFGCVCISASDMQKIAPYMTEVSHMYIIPESENRDTYGKYLGVQKEYPGFKYSEFLEQMQQITDQEVQERIEKCK